MEFVWWVAAITVLAMLVEAFVSYKEETFWRSQKRHVHMTFMWNLAISVGGLVILPIFNALGFSQLRAGLGFYIIGCLIGVIITWFCYWLWWKQGDENKGHVLYWSAWNDKERVAWTANVTAAGCLHFLYMTIEIAIMFVYLLSPMSQSTVLVAGGLFLIYVALVNVQAKVVQRSFRWPVFIGELTAVVIVTAAKL